jgi:hypothetical protein
VENLNSSEAGAEHHQASPRQMKRDNEVEMDEEAEIDFARNRYI